MLQRARRTGKSDRSRGGSAASSSPDRQSRLGNAALQSRSTGQGSAAAVSDDEAMSWLSESAPAASGGAQSFPEGPELAEPGATGPMRPTSVRKGMKGALIWTGTEVTLTKDVEGKQALGTVADGATARVKQVKEERIKVQVRLEKKNVEGWVDAEVFSEQPTLTKDEDDSALDDDFVYSMLEGDHSPKAPKGKDTAQGFAGNCFLIASMAAVANASPQVIKDAVKYDKDKGTYTVRFYEEQYGGKFKPVYIVVDSYLPTAKDNRKDPVYAGDEGGVMWSAIVEKAYAKWKGGYDVIGEGGVGSSTMEELTGARSTSKSPSAMKEKDVIPWFEQAKKDGKAIYAGTKDGAKSEVQTPMAGSGDGPFKGKVSHTHRWNEINPGTVSITDKQGKASSARDSGSHGDKTGKLTGSGVKSGTIGYKGDTANQLELTYAKGRGPKEASDLQVQFEYEGVLDVAKTIIANHAYAFEGVVGGKELQFYNPWGTYQPKPITPAEFLKNYDSLSVNQPPAAKKQS